MPSIASAVHFRQRVIRYAEKHGVTGASVRHQLSRNAIYEWRAKYDAHWKNPIYRSHSPHSHPNQHSEAEKAMILSPNPHLDASAQWQSRTVASD